METHIKLIVLLILFALTQPVEAGNIYRYKIDYEDVKSINGLFENITWEGHTFKIFPIEESPDFPWSPYIEFKKTGVIDRRIEGKDTVIVENFTVLKVDLNISEVKGKLTDLSLPNCTSLIISETKITGPIPKLNLPNCRYIDLSLNKLSGEIPDLNLKKLEVLDLHLNELTGSLKDYDLPELKILKLYNNRLTGKIIFFTKMPLLEELAIDGNKFTSLDIKYDYPKLKKFIYNNVSGDTTKLSGPLAQFDCPELEELSITIANLTGNISDLKLPKCKSIYLWWNNLSGEIPDLQMPNLETLNIGGNELTGEVPSFKGCPNLKNINLENNKLTSINSSFNPVKLEYLFLKSNKLTGLIPALKIQSLKILDLSHNDFSSVLPVFILPSLEEFNLSYNKITGDLPELDMPNLRIFNMESNNLNGKISNFNSKNLETLKLNLNPQIKGPLPAFDLPKLKELIITFSKIEGSLPVMNLPVAKKIILKYNNMTGTIPPLNYPKAEELNLSANQFTGELPSINLPEVLILDLSGNNLTGKIPAMIIPKATNLSLSLNKLTGEIPAMNIPNVKSLSFTNNMFTGSFGAFNYPLLKSLSLSENDLDSVPNLKSLYPNLTLLSIKGNKLQFNHIEPNLGILNYYYTPQDSIFHFKQSIGALTRFYVKTGGSQNKYQWSKKKGVVWYDIPDATQSSYTTTFVKGDEYSCRVTNTLATKLTLYSKLAEDPSCIALGMFDICNMSGEWANGEKNQLVSTGKVKINDFINFEGVFIVDTVMFTVKANGSFYLTEIPLPGGSQIGRFDLAKGDYELTLLGDSGVITNFLNGQIKEYAELAGVDLKIEKLKLLGGRSANSVELDIKLSIPGIAGKCEEISKDDPNAEVALKGLKISADGFSMNGASIENMSLFIKSFCIKKIEAGYDREKNEFTAAADIQLPFGQVAGGFKLTEGLIDSIGWRLEAAKPPFVIGTTTIGVKGFFGHISSITQPAIEVELGGIFEDIISDDFYSVDASGRTIWPTMFEVKGDGKFMRPPGLKLPYQLNSVVTMTYDHPLSQFKVAFDGKIGTSDDKKWLMTAQGEFKISANTSPPKFAGSLTGEMSLPKFRDGFPYSWLESFAPFPLKGTTNATFVWGRSHLLHGDVTFILKTLGKFKLKYVADLSKTYGSDDFLWFETDISLKSNPLRSASGVFLQEVEIPAKTEYAVIRVSGKTDLPVSGLINPSGKKLTGSSEADNVLYSNSGTGKESYWTLLNPAAGKWNVEIQDKTVDDSVFVYLKKADSDFDINLTQNGNSVTVTWDKSLFSQDYTIYLMLDEDNQNFDGFSVSEGPANTGSQTFELSNQLNSCSYYLFAQVQGAKETFSKYSKVKLINSKSILTPPVDFSAVYDENTGITKVTYYDNNDQNTVGYIITFRDSVGKDSVYAVVNRRNGIIDLNIKDALKSTFFFTSYGENGLLGCPSEPEMITGLFKTASKDVETLSVFPNPVNGVATISYFLKTDGRYEINITDITGRILNRPVSGKQFAGYHEFEWNPHGLQDGVYLVVLKTDYSIKTVKCILRK